MTVARRAGTRRSYIRLTFVDILGIPQNVTIPVSELERALDGGVTFDGGSIDGFVRGEEVDMILRPTSRRLRSIRGRPGTRSRRV